MNALMALMFLCANFVIIMGAIVVFLLNPRPNWKIHTHVGRLSLLGIIGACASSVARNLTATGVIETEQVVLAVSLAIALVVHARFLAILHKEGK